MKKLLIALGIAAVAVCTQAASFSWSSTGLATSKNIYAKDGSTLLYAANNAAVLYLFDAAVVSQDALLTALRADSTKTLADFTSVAHQDIASNSRITTQAVTYGTADGNYNFYMAVINGDDVFLSASTAAAGQQSDTSPITINGLTSATKNTFADTTATFASNGAGWYAVPEPTSGLMLLLGMAGLALKRKRA